MARREYEGDDITVHWDSDRCIHSELCVLGAPAVFDRGARPWVQLEGATADDVARVIDTCPSGALSYTQTDGAPNGRRGRSVDEDDATSVRAEDAGATVLALVTPLPNGPLHVRGPIAITSAAGEVEVFQRATLCRCGHSGSKPHCDGSHQREGFVAPGAVPG